MTKKRAVRISEAEWDVMEVVWNGAPVAAATVADVLHQKRRWTLTTVRTLLRRLVGKGALEQVVEGRRYEYSPLISREECVRRESESFLDRVLGRAPAASLLHLVERTELSPAEIEELRRILRAKENRS